MNEQRPERLPDFAEKILKSLGKESPGFLGSDKSLPPENVPLVINEELGIMNLVAHELGEYRGIFISRYIDQLRELYSEQEEHLKNKVREMVEPYEWLSEEEVPDWVFEEV